MNNNNNNIIKQFMDFMNANKGQDPQKILNDMLASGKITQQDVERAKKEAEKYAFLKNFIK